MNRKTRIEESFLSKVPGLVSTIFLRKEYVKILQWSLHRIWINSHSLQFHFPMTNFSLYNQGRIVNFRLFKQTTQMYKLVLKKNSGKILFIMTQKLSVCFYYVTYAIEWIYTLSLPEWQVLCAQNRPDFWNVGNYNVTRTQDHLVHKWTLNALLVIIFIPLSKEFIIYSF